MKPYFKVLYNKLRLICIKKFICPGVIFKGIQLLGYNTKIVLKKNSKLVLGNRIISDGRCVIVIDENAILRIGNNVYFNEGMMISSKSYISIGDGCQFGPNVKIFDNNHKFDTENGVLADHSVGEIVIGNNCWIAANVTILKDTRIEDNCVIGAGCIVKGRIPKGSIVTPEIKLNIRSIDERRYI